LKDPGDKAIKGFDGLRGIAVMLVVLAHAGITENLVDGPATALVGGSTGVTIFFALSGFLITFLLKREHENTGTISLPNFYFRRVLRIFPLYFLVICLTFVISKSIYPLGSDRAFLAAAVYMSNFTPVVWYSRILVHTWSLAVEEHFYLFWPLILLLLRFHWGRSIALLCVAIGASILLLNGLLSIPQMVNNFFVARWTPIAGAAIAVGCLCALLISNSPHQAACVAVLRSRKVLAVSLILFAGPAIAGFLWAGPRPSHLAWPNDVAPMLPGHLDDAVQAAGAALLITWIYLNQSSLLTSGLEFAPLRYVGRISYGIYMWQGFFLANGPDRAPDQLWPPNSWVGLMCLFVTAPLSFHFFEKRILDLKHRFKLVNWTLVSREKPLPDKDLAPGLKL
jgi:peptidoglycan/LPS O-acetylase OafA/YrhL